jgi:hypothetical protein
LVEVPGHQRWWGGCKLSKLVSQTTPHKTQGMETVVRDTSMNKITHRIDIIKTPSDLTPPHLANLFNAQIIVRKRSNVSRRPIL